MHSLNPGIYCLFKASGLLSVQMHHFPMHQEDGPETLPQGLLCNQDMTRMQRNTTYRSHCVHGPETASARLSKPDIQVIADSLLHGCVCTSFPRPSGSSFKCPVCAGPECLTRLVSNNPEVRKEGCQEWACGIVTRTCIYHHRIIETLRWAVCFNTVMDLRYGSGNQVVNIYMKSYICLLYIF